MFGGRSAAYPQADTPTTRQVFGTDYRRKNMPEMIQVNDLVTFECPHCGYITKGKRGEKVNCPKCQPDFSGYFLGAKNTEQANQPDSQ